MLEEYVLRDVVEVTADNDEPLEAGIVAVVAVTAVIARHTPRCADHVHQESTQGYDVFTGNRGQSR